MLEFVDSGLYFVQDKNNFINPLLQVGSGSGFIEKRTGSGPKINGSDRIRILIPANIVIIAGGERIAVQRNPIVENGKCLKSI